MQSQIHKPAMYDPTPQQIESEKILVKAGFSFLNWISAQDAPDDSLGCMVFAKRGATKYGKEYREVSPDGSIN